MSPALSGSGTVMSIHNTRKKELLAPQAQGGNVSETLEKRAAVERGGAASPAVR